MQALVFIPGLMGTELVNAKGDIIWPPKPIEILTGYRRINELQGDDLVPSNIITSVSCRDIYETVLEQLKDLGFTEQSSSKRLYLFPYDWRLDLETTARKLADLLASVEQQGAEKITLVAHSMGGLITRLVLENPSNQDTTWIKKIDQFLALAVPQKGAPLALARILGLDSDMGISAADFATFSNNPKFPSGYQLLPAPGIDTLWDQSVQDLPSLNIYDEAVAYRMGLNTELLERTQYVHNLLNIDRKPTHVRYFHFAGTGHNTVTRINIVSGDITAPNNGQLKVTWTKSAGDGTVVLTSALDSAQQQQMVVNSHTEVFQGMAFKSVFYGLLGGNIGDAVRAADNTLLSISAAQLTYKVSQDFEILLTSTAAIERAQGELILEKLDSNGNTTTRTSITSVDTPLSADAGIPFLVKGIQEPGFYRIVFDGTLSTEGIATFAVTRA